MYEIYVKYNNTDDGSKTQANSNGKSIEELFNDIIFFISKKNYYCKKCRKTHGLKIKSIKINFKTK